MLKKLFSYIKNYFSSTPLLDGQEEHERFLNELSKLKAAEEAAIANVMDTKKYSPQNTSKDTETAPTVRVMSMGDLKDLYEALRFSEDVFERNIMNELGLSDFGMVTFTIRHPVTDKDVVVDTSSPSREAVNLLKMVTKMDLQ